MSAALESQDEVDGAKAQRRKDREWGALETGRFEKVSFRERCSDRWQAFCDALTRLHRSTDPIVTYDGRLAASIEAVRASTRIKSATVNTIKEERPSPVSEEDVAAARQRDIHDKRANVVTAQAALANLRLEEVSTQRFTRLHQFLSAELKQQRDIFDRWVTKLGRPAYGDRLGDPLIPAWFKYQPKYGGTDSPQPHADSSGPRTTLKIGKLFNVAPVLLIPAEVFFALPGFEFLTPDDKLAALMGAAIFTALLAILGHAAAMFLIRGIVNRVDSGCTYQPRPLIAAFVLLNCAVLMSFAGADLRGKLPDIAALEDRKSSLIQAESELRSEALNDTNMERADAIAAEQSKLDIERGEIQKTQRDLYGLDYSLQKSDKMIALWVYFALFLVAAGRVILSRDPVFEYELVTIAVREREHALSRIDAARETERLYWREEMHKLRNHVAYCRAELKKVAPADPLALPEGGSGDDEACARDETTQRSNRNVAVATGNEASGTHHGSGVDHSRGKVIPLGTDYASHSDKEAVTSVDPAAAEAFEQLSLLWRSDRLQRYTQWYQWFSWRGLDEHAESRSKAFARLPVTKTSETV